jgi:hypothetical protein
MQLSFGSLEMEKRVRMESPLMKVYRLIVKRSARS